MLYSTENKNKLPDAAFQLYLYKVNFEPVTEGTLGIGCRINLQYKKNFDAHYVKYEFSSIYELNKYLDLLSVQLVGYFNCLVPAFILYSNQVFDISIFLNLFEGSKILHLDKHSTALLLASESCACDSLLVTKYFFQTFESDVVYTIFN